METSYPHACCNTVVYEGAARTTAPAVRKPLNRPVGLGVKPITRNFRNNKRLNVQRSLYVAPVTQLNLNSGAECAASEASAKQLKIVFDSQEKIKTSRSNALIAEQHQKDQEVLRDQQLLELEHAQARRNIFEQQLHTLDQQQHDHIQNLQVLLHEDAADIQTSQFMQLLALKESLSAQLAKLHQHEENL
jgi:hypothetical protein